MELDQFMKELAGDFLREVMELFFPHIAQSCDFSQKKDLNKELYTKSPEGEERFVDVLLEVRCENPPPSVWLIHVESQQKKRVDFSARMLAYQCLIYTREIESERQDSFSIAEFNEWKNRTRILSFVFCNYVLKAGITQEEYKTGLTETHLNCRYTCISLPVLSAREYLEKDNSVVCVLAVFMNPEGLSKPDLKVSCYRKLLSYKESLTTRQINQIVYALETYLTLTEHENQIYQRLITQVYPEVNEMITNPLIEQGRQQELQESIVRFLSHRFQQISPSLHKKIYSLTDIQKLRALLDTSIEVKSLEDLEMNGFFD